MFKILKKQSLWPTVVGDGGCKVPTAVGLSAVGHDGCDKFRNGRKILKNDLKKSKKIGSWGRKAEGRRVNS
jgi:hypothetical protein